MRRMNTAVLESLLMNAVLIDTYSTHSYWNLVWISAGRHAMLGCSEHRAYPACSWSTHVWYLVLHLTPEMRLSHPLDTFKINVALRLTYSVKQQQPLTIVNSPLSPTQPLPMPRFRLYVDSARLIKVIVIIGYYYCYYYFVAKWGA